MQRTQVLHFVSAFRTIFFSEMQRTRKSLDLQNFQARRGQNMGVKNPYLERKTVEDYDTAAKNSRYCIRSWWNGNGRWTFWSLPTGIETENEAFSEKRSTKRAEPRSVNLEECTRTYSPCYYYYYFLSFLGNPRHTYDDCGRSSHARGPLRLGRTEISLQQI